MSKHAKSRNKGKAKAVPGLRDTDMVIPIVGPTGAGKSSFINTAVSKDVASVGGDLKSCTTTIQHYELLLRGEHQCRIVLVDTPGFDNATIEDSEVLRRIDVWLAQSRGNNMKLAGIIYLHDITMRRIFKTVGKNFDIFKKLCGDGALPNIILATTMWDEVPFDVGEKREQQLRVTYWKDMLEQGSSIHRFDGTPSSAHKLINFIIDTRHKAPRKQPINRPHPQEELAQTSQPQAIQRPLTSQPMMTGQFQEQSWTINDQSKTKENSRNRQKQRPSFVDRLIAFFKLG